jgi:AraC family transcriptional regulator of adaptative response/methylated-DNA-[protein]-cysteine methyltransferase
MNELLPSSHPCYGFHTSPFGECCIVFSDKGICALSFPESRESAFSDLYQRFPKVIFKQDDKKAADYVTQIFKYGLVPKLDILGSEFQQTIWQALQQTKIGETITYFDVAERIGRPKAVRAVGTAIAANPIAFLIPCHRVVRSDGSLGGFRWGVACKIAMLEWEKQNAIRIH